MTKGQRALGFTFALVSLGATCVPARADEGMWTFDNPPLKLLQQKYGFTPTQAWLDHLRLSCVRLNDGGSGSFVSPHGLLLTNHHVARGQLQKNSTKEHDYIRDGFYAATPEAEMKSPDLEVNVLESMENVTPRVNAALQGAKTPEAEFAKRKAVIADIERESLQKTGLRSDVVTLYQGGEYWLYRYKKYTDVRLVFAPEEQAAFFGGDPDNFTYPRHDIDMALFRVYDNGKPIDSKDYLKWNPQGAKDEELVFVAGHPGSTSRMDTLAQLEVERDVATPSLIRLFKHRIEVLRQYSALGPEQAREAGSDIFGMENSLKAYEGRLKGLLDKNVWDSKRKDEAAFRATVMANPQWKAAYGGAWDQIAQAEKKSATRLKERWFHSTGSDLIGLASEIVQYVAEIRKPDAQRLPGFHEAQLESLRYGMFSPAPLYPALEIARISGQLDQDLAEMGPNDPFLKVFLNGRNPKEVAETLVKGTKLSDPDFRKKLVEGGEAAVAASDDPMIVLARKTRSHAARDQQMEGRQRPERGAARRRATWQSAFRRIRQKHLSGCHVYPAPFLRPGEGLPDERHAGAFEDHILRPLRSRPELRFSRSVVPAFALQRRPGQTGPGDAARFRDHQRHHRRQFRLTRRSIAPAKS